jgi:hypothetical protein
VPLPLTSFLWQVQDLLIEIQGPSVSILFPLLLCVEFPLLF